MANLAKLSLSLLAICLLGLGLAVFAEGDNVQPEDLGVSSPNILPDSPLYIFKIWVREIQSFFTFDSLAKAKLKEKFANEKLMELKKMVEENKSSEKLESAIQNYQSGIEGVKKVTESIKEKAEENEQVSEFLDKFIQHQALHQQVLEKLEIQVPTEVFEKIKEVREQHLEKFGEVMTKLETKKEELQERLEKNLQEIQGKELEEKTIQIRDRVLEKIQQKEKSGLQVCIALWDPVCGKDGKTYSNNCFANLAGVEVDYQGECK